MKKSGKKQVKKAKDTKKVAAAKKAWKTIRAKAEKRKEMEGQKGWKDFDEELRNRGKFVKHNHGYRFAVFERMYSQHGLQEATKQIAMMPDSPGFRWLWEHNLLDLSIEAIILRPEYREMWEAEEKKDKKSYRELCREKLKKLNYRTPEIQTANQSC